MGTLTNLYELEKEFLKALGFPTENTISLTLEFSADSVPVATIEYMPTTEQLELLTSIVKKYQVYLIEEFEDK